MLQNLLSFLTIFPLFGVLVMLIHIHGLVFIGGVQFEGWHEMYFNDRLCY